MQRVLCKSKIHRATVTEADLNYEGSFTIDADLMDAADMIPYEKVQIYNITTGARAETYLIEGPRGSGQMCANGALARLVQKNDLVIVVSFGLYEENEIKNLKPKMILVDQNNKIQKYF